MSTCTTCGTPLAADARFCPKCGTAVVAAAPPRVPYTPAPPPLPANAAGRGAWWIVPLIVVGIVLIAWLLLAGLPFRRDEKRVVAAPATETIAEGTAPAAAAPETGTIVDVTETAPPPLATATVPPPAQAQVPVDTAPPPVVVEEPVTRTPPAPPRPVPTTPRPAPVPVEPAPGQRQPGGEITEGEAAATLRGFITSRSYYSDVASGCVQVRNQGYRNVGYTFSVWDACVSGGGSRMLGRWRVDAQTREVFRQQEDGRYLKP